MVQKINWQRDRFALIGIMISIGTIFLNFYRPTSFTVAPMSFGMGIGEPTTMSLGAVAVIIGVISVAYLMFRK